MAGLIHHNPARHQAGDGQDVQPPQDCGGGLPWCEQGRIPRPRANCGKADRVKRFSGAQGQSGAGIEGSVRRSLAGGGRQFDQRIQRAGAANEAGGSRTSIERNAEIASPEDCQQRPPKTRSVTFQVVKKPPVSPTWHVHGMARGDDRAG